TTLPSLHNQITILAGVASEADDAVIDKLRDQLVSNPGSARVERLEIVRQTGPLFTTNGVRLPTLEANGKPQAIRPDVGQAGGFPRGFDLKTPSGGIFQTPGLAKPADSSEKPDPPATTSP